jgi:Tol biopolymer transport system component
VFAALEGDRMQIFTVPEAGGPAVRVTDGTGNFLHPRASPDGRWIAFTHIETVNTIHRQSLTLEGKLVR